MRYMRYTRVYVTLIMIIFCFEIKGIDKRNKESFFSTAPFVLNKNKNKNKNKNNGN